MMMIIGGSSVVITLSRLLFGGDGGFLARQMEHPEWFGLTFFDTIFPAFLFIAGIAFPFSYAGQLSRGMTKSHILLRCFKRMVILIAIGWVVNVATCGWPGVADFRYGSVLAKIGMGWFFASVLFVCFPRCVRYLICAAILIAYAVLLTIFVAPDYPTASSFSIEGNFIGWLDRTTMPGRLWQGAMIDGKYVKNLCEPSGLYANFFAAPTAMLGMFAGEIVRDSRFTGGRKTIHLLLMAFGLLLAGLAMTLFVPISKKLWTPSFTLIVASYSTAMFAFFYYLVDVRLRRRWVFPFTVVGMNAITIYILKSFAEFGAVRWWIFGESTVSPLVHACLAGAYFSVCWLITYLLWRKKWFLKV